MDEGKGKAPDLVLIQDIDVSIVGYNPDTFTGGRCWEEELGPYKENVISKATKLSPMTSAGAVDKGKGKALDLCAPGHGYGHVNVQS